VIAAGGKGTRIGAAAPKQFIELAGKPVLLHSLERILQLENVVQVIIALPAHHVRHTRALIEAQGLKVPVECVRGGAERQDSVHRAVLKVRADAEMILVHDAVRPLCDAATMQRVVDAAWVRGGAVPGLPATETIQRVSRRGRIVKTPPREELYSIQTPQCFRAEILRRALARAQSRGFMGTDESSVVRWAGYPVAVVPGSPDNIKITRPVDFEVAERLLNQHSLGAAMSYRIGQGMDYHRLVEGRKLILGGVEVPFGKGLAGHSDADAFAHAVCDALLGAAALGDIGQHFPDSDPMHRGRSSLEFLREVRAMLERAGWVILNVDVTLVAEHPRLAPFFARMRQGVAGALGISEAQMSIKATTSEGMNAEGRGEGISAHAVALIERKKAATNYTN